jgi:hypothetical protein
MNAAPAAATETPPSTGWDEYDGQNVTVQLFEPYVLGMDRQTQQPMLTPVLQGQLKITDGFGSAKLFVLRIEQGGAEAFVTVHPGDVKHLTWFKEQSRIQRV